MALTKHASFDVLSARIAQTGDSLVRTAHRVEFEYEPKPGFLYVRSRAISSRCNDNFDEFPAEEIKTAYRTFIGKPVFVNHHNANHRRARGVIIDAALHEDRNPDGTPDTWVEVLMEVDAIRFPKLAEAIVKGHIERTSMGTDVAYSVCSACGNKAASPLDYCQHIPRMKGKRIYRTTASGSKEGVLIREICYGLGFFENSLLVEDPADPTAYFLGVDTRGVADLAAAAAKTASKTAAKRFVTQCNHASESHGMKDNRTGDVVKTYPTHNQAVKAVRAANEEHEDRLAHPDEYREGSRKTAAITESWTEVKPGYWARRTAYPEIPAQMIVKDDGNGSWLWEVSVSTFIGAPHEVRPWNGKKNPSGKAKSLQDAQARAEKSIAKDHEFYQRYDERQRAMLERLSAKDDYVAPSSTKDPDRYKGTTIKQDEKGYYVHTHRARSKSYPSPEAIPDSAIAEIEATGSRKVASRRKTAKTYSTTCSGCSAPLRVSSNSLTVKGTRPSNGVRGRNHVPAGEVVSEAYITDETGESLIYWDCPLCGYADSLDLVEYTGSRRTAITFDQGGRVTAPGQVDTLREEKCPVCGEGDSYDGMTCQVCGFETPPSEFGDPDLSKAKQVDLRQEQEEDQGDRFKCDHCDATFAGGVKVALILDKDKGQDDDVATPQADQGVAAGQTCPECQQGTLQAVPTSVDTSEPAPGEQGAPGVDPEAEEGDEFAPAAEEDPIVPGEDEKDAEPDPEDFAPAAEEKDDDVAPAEDDEDDEDDDDDKVPSFLKKKKPTAARRGSDTRRSTVEMRPALAALAEQQQQIDLLTRAVSTLATAAGVGSHPHFASLTKRAEDENPAQPSGWANPAGSSTESPAVTTEEARSPEGTDDVESQGSSSLTDVTPDATTDVSSTGEVIAAPLDLNEQDVTAPVAGTETLGDGGRGNAGTNRTETEVRVGDPNASQTAFNDGGFLSSKSASSERTMASLRLARLQIQAGISAGDDLALSAAIAASDATNGEIQTKIATLDQVVAARPAAQGERRPVARSLVPQASRQASRAVPSLSAEASIPQVEFATPVHPDEVGFE